MSVPPQRPPNSLGWVKPNESRSAFHFWQTKSENMSGAPFFLTCSWEGGTEVPSVLHAFSSTHHDDSIQQGNLDFTLPRKSPRITWPTSQVSYSWGTQMIDTFCTGQSDRQTCDIKKIEATLESQLNQRPRPLEQTLFYPVASKTKCRNLQSPRKNPLRWAIAIYSPRLSQVWKLSVIGSHVLVVMSLHIWLKPNPHCYIWSRTFRNTHQLQI